MTSATKDEDREPTMEEILASIRQIISDDEEKGGGDAEGEGGDEAPEEEAAADEEPAVDKEPTDGGDDVLELTEVAPDIEDVLDLEPGLGPSLENAVEAEGDPVLENDFDSIEVEEPASAPVAVTVEAAPVASPAVDLHTLLSDHAADVTTETFSGLTGAVSAARGMPMGNTHQTLEELVKDLLRPMLKEWLDENLPTLVERLVEKEIVKLVGRAEKG
jgi:cell pole-organizing protein PopZ